MMAQIDPLVVLIIFVGGLLAIGITAWMLNRAWGDFPSRSGLPRSAPTSPVASPIRNELWARGPAEEVQPDEEREPPLPAGASPANMVAVTHPLVVRAVQQALAKPGSPYTTYFISEGERVYLVLSRIADPAQRETARRVFEGLSSGDLQGLEIGEMIQMISQLGKR